MFSNFTESNKLYCSTVPSQIDDGLQFGQCSWMLYKGVIRGVNDRYPHKKAAKIAIQTLKESSGGLLEVHFVLFNESVWNVWLAEAEACLKKA
jgi:hypothetical protein